MIVYRELSSLTTDLGFSARTLYSVARNVRKHYHNVSVPKKDGTERKLSVPDELLKRIQKSIAEKILINEEISPYATAYRVCASPVVNAKAHLGKRCILKLDINHFFDSIIFPAVKNKVFPKEKYSEANRILLTALCIYEDSVPQGAPTSPVISNIILREFDFYIGSWCSERGITYTRYCDDMTFSGEFEAKEVIKEVEDALKKEGFFLNRKKTTFIKNGQRKEVTGIVVNEKLSVSKDYRRKIRSEVYYIKKYGVESHLSRIGNDMDELKYLMSLFGRINYVLSVSPGNEEMKNYRKTVRNIIYNLK